MRVAAERLRATFEGIQRQHRGEAGRAREDDVRETLRAFLPQRFGLVGGEVISADGTHSPQIDIIIYDALETPLLAGPPAALVPVEGVFAVIEVSSHLDTRKVREDADKIAHVKRLKRSSGAYLTAGVGVTMVYGFQGRATTIWPILGFAFAYDSAGMDTLLAAVCDLDREAPLEHRLDMICSLSRGCIANGVPGTTPDGARVYTRWASTPEPSTERFAIPIDPQEQPGHAFLIFYVLASMLLGLAQAKPLTLAPYWEARDDWVMPYVLSTAEI